MGAGHTLGQLQEEWLGYVMEAADGCCFKYFLHLPQKHYLTNVKGE